MIPDDHDHDENGHLSEDVSSPSMNLSHHGQNVSKARVLDLHLNHHRSYSRYFKENTFWFLIQGFTDILCKGFCLHPRLPNWLIQYPSKRINWYTCAIKYIGHYSKGKGIEYSGLSVYYISGNTEGIFSHKYKGSLIQIHRFLLYNRRKGSYSKFKQNTMEAVRWSYEGGD